MKTERQIKVRAAKMRALLNGWDDTALWYLKALEWVLEDEKS